MCLEQEFKVLCVQQRQIGIFVGGGGSYGGFVEFSVLWLFEQLWEKEEQILVLEVDMIKWEQKYLEEWVMRQFVMDVVVIVVVQCDIIFIWYFFQFLFSSSFNEGLLLGNYRYQEMESRLKVFYVQILEKDVVIKVFQQCFRKDFGKVIQGILWFVKLVLFIFVVVVGIQGW